MDAVLWSDYICPWCYLGRDRSALLQSLGITITARPYELHPRLPLEGIPSERRYSRIAAACAEVGMPFNPPGFVPNSRRALAAAEAVRLTSPDAFETLDSSLFTAYFVEGRNIGDPDVIAELVEQSGAQPVDYDVSLLKASMEEAYEADVSGTPAWRIDGRLLIVGVQDRSYYEVMVERLKSRGKAV
jgi:predicted DsbA family dithiol-disulfide isomerase